MTVVCVPLHFRASVRTYTLHNPHRTGRIKNYKCDIVGEQILLFNVKEL